MSDTPRTKTAALSKQSGALRDECENLERELNNLQKEYNAGLEHRIERENWIKQLTKERDDAVADVERLRIGNIVLSKELDERALPLLREATNELTSLRRKVAAAEGMADAIYWINESALPSKRDFLITAHAKNLCVKTSTAWQEANK